MADWCSTCGKDTAEGATECDVCKNWWKDNMYTFGQLPDYAEQLNAVVGPTGGDWLFELCRRYRRTGMPFVEAMAKAKEETKYLRVASVAAASNRPEWRQKRHAELSK